MFLYWSLSNIIYWYLFRGLSRRNWVVLCGVRWGHVVDTTEQALLWHQDGNDLMFYVVSKGLKDCMTYSNTERKINHVYLVVWLEVCFSQQFGSSWCQVDRLLVGRTIASLTGKSFFTLAAIPGYWLQTFYHCHSYQEEAFTVGTWVFLWAYMNLRHLNQNFSIVGFQNS